MLFARQPIGCTPHVDARLRQPRIAPQKGRCVGARYSLWLFHRWCWDIRRGEWRGRECERIRPPIRRRRAAGDRRRDADRRALLWNLWGERVWRAGFRNLALFTCDVLLRHRAQALAQKAGCKPVKERKHHYRSLRFGGDRFRAPAGTGCAFVKFLNATMICLSMRESTGTQRPNLLGAAQRHDRRGRLAFHRRADRA